MVAPNVPRDRFLDCLKGFAIVTVVLGHTFQAATPQFDTSLPFRIIYAFHMPMFMFISGMTASLAVSRRLGQATQATVYASDIRSKAVRLIVPFFTWAMIKYAISHPDGYSAAGWLRHVIALPDDGLWFLWVLFQCSCALALIELATQAAVGVFTRVNGTKAPRRASLYLIFILTGLIVSLLIRALPDVSGLNLTKVQFVYFFAGAVFHMLRPAGLPASTRWIPYVAFAALVPFWYRTGAAPPLNALPFASGLIALAGTLAFVDLVRRVAETAARPLTQAIAFLGQRSLDIYAIHFYVLSIFPPVFAPIALSLVISALLRTNPISSWLCLGQKPAPLWRGGMISGFGAKS